MNVGSAARFMIIRTGRLLVLSSIVALGAGASAQERPPIRTFDAETPGAVPADLALVASRQPGPGIWRIAQRPDETFLMHAADVAATGYALALVPDAPLQNVAVTIRITLAGGARAGGLVWRYQDPQNYYATILDLTAGVITMQRIVDGNRITLERRGDLELDPSAWHTLKVVHDGSEVYVSLGGIRVINERDRRLDRFGPGRTGLIATGDSEVWFDDLRIERPRERR
jgi:hypothetical protein